MLPAGWLGDLLLLGVLLGAGVLAGLHVDLPGLGATLALLVYLAVCARRLVALERWLVRSAAVGGPPPALGGPLGWIGERIRRMQGHMQRDFDERDRRIGRLRDSYAALRDGVVMLDADRAIEWSNPAAARLLGLRYPEDVGQPVGNLVRDPAFLAYLASGDVENAVEFVLQGGRGLALQVQATRFGPSGTVLFVRDLTTLRRLETVRRDFVANISHELRTPLTVIAGYVATLQELLPADSPAVAKALAQMRAQAVRMETLLEDLLLLARLETDDSAAFPEDEPIAICALLAEVREHALASCGGEREILLDCPAGLRYRASRMELESIFSNLVFNAVKYTSPGGHIAVRLAREADCLRLSVRDDGIGIDPVHLPRLTERFYRVDKGRSVERGGTGLGLAIVKHALHRLGGELAIDSRPGAGSEFACRLPLERLEPEQADAPAA